MALGASEWQIGRPACNHHVPPTLLLLLQLPVHDTASIIHPPVSPYGSFGYVIYLRLLVRYVGLSRTLQVWRSPCLSLFTVITDKKKDNDCTHRPSSFHSGTDCVAGPRVLYIDAVVNNAALASLDLMLHAARPLDIEIIFGPQNEWVAHVLMCSPGFLLETSAGWRWR